MRAVRCRAWIERRIARSGAYVGVSWMHYLMSIYIYTLHSSSILSFPHDLAMDLSSLQYITALFRHANPHILSQSLVSVIVCHWSLVILVHIYLVSHLILMLCRSSPFKDVVCDDQVNAIVVDDAAFGTPYSWVLSSLSSSCLDCVYNPLSNIHAFLSATTKCKVRRGAKLQRSYESMRVHRSD